MTIAYFFLSLLFEPRCEKTGLRGFRPGPTQTGLYSHRRWLETRNFVFMNNQCSENKAVTAKLICVFVFAYAKSRFSHDAAHLKNLTCLREHLRTEETPSYFEPTI